MSKQSGPLPIHGKLTQKINSHNEVETQSPYRNYECENYNRCLDLAAALDWSGFTCQNCCQQIDQKLIWRASQNCKHDRVASLLCAGVDNEKPRPKSGLKRVVGG